MQCFSLAFIENLLIWVVIILGVLAFVKLVVPAIMNAVGTPPGGGIIMQVINIVIWVILAIAIIVIVFDLLACLVGGPGVGLRSLR